MRWRKLGHVFDPSQRSEWMHNTALTPTPVLLDSETIRVYCGFRDLSGVSRIGYVDVSSDNPTHVKRVSKVPVLDIGRPGCFDDNGVILGDIVRKGSSLRMFYVGFQLVKRAKFLAFTGLATSDDNGETFHRVSESPVLDRASDGVFIMAVHSSIPIRSGERVWFAKGNGWEAIGGSAYPQYDIWTTSTSNGITFSENSVRCIENDKSKNEYRIGRPSAFPLPASCLPNKYGMFFTKGSTGGTDYFPGYAESTDGIIWHRDDKKLGIQLSSSGWDSRHLCYPRILTAAHKTFLFYNGNDMGLSGFGVAELESWQ